MTYTLATFDSRSGTFTVTVGQPISHFLIYGTNSITLTPIPEPALLVLIGAGGLALAARRRRVRG